MKAVKIEEKCDNASYCGAKRSCPAGAVIYDQREGIIIDKDRCIGCGICVRACPRKALMISEE